MVCAIAIPLSLGAASYGLGVAPPLRDRDETIDACRLAAGRLHTAVARGREVADADIADVAQDVAWIRNRVPSTSTPAVFVEELGELIRELGIGRFEYHSGAMAMVADTGYRVDPIDVRVVAPYRLLLALWARLEALDRPILCRNMHLRRYGDAVAATFAIELFSRPSALAGDARRDGGTG
jgi:hypothetical protein